MFWYRFTNFDRFLLIGAAIVMLLSTFLILDDRWLFKVLSTSSDSLEKIGMTKTAVSDVRRRHSTAFSWMPLDEKDDVFQGDSIYTGDKSEAVIITDRGEQLSISPNSLVVINAKSDSIRLDIDFGSVLGKISKDQKLLIAAGGDVTEFEGDDAIVKVDVGADQNLVVNVLEGQVEVTSDSGRRSLGPSQQAEISDEGAIFDPSDVRLELLSPVPDRVLKPDEGRDLVLTWRSSYNFSEYNIEIAEDGAFQKIVIKDKVPRPLYRPPTLPTNQRLFWRVSASLKANQPLAKSPTNAFTIAEDNPPQFIFPRNNMRFTFEEQPGEDGRRLQVAMRWYPKSVSIKWEVQLATSPDFAKDLKIFESRDPSLNLGLLSEGEYHSRIRAKDWSDAQWSDTASFYILRRPPASMKPPQLLSVDDTFLLSTKTVGVTAQELALASQSKTGEYVEAIPELAWNTIPGATSYDLEISSNSDFSRIIHRAEVPSTRYGWESVRLGRYYWRIRSINSGSRRGTFSESQKLVVTLAPPRNLTNEKVIEEITAVMQMESAPPPFLIRWSPTLFTVRYEMEFDKGAKMEKPLRLYTQNPFKKVQAAQPGVYYWRVRSIDAGNRPLTEWTPVFKYDYERKLINPDNTKELRALNPVNETIMLIGDGELKINFRWATPLKSGKYRFQMSSGKNFAKPKYDFLTDKDFFLLREKLNDGWFYWRLRIETPQYTSAWTPGYEFQIKHEQTSFSFERSEKLQEEEIKRIETLRKQVTDSEAARDIAESKQFAKEMEASLPQIETPTDLSGPDVFSLETRALPASMKRLEQLEMTELWKHLREQPTLEWQPVTNATSYRVEIAEDANFTKKVETLTTPLPSIRWNTVRPGKFYWRVSASGRRFRPSSFTSAENLEVNVRIPKISTPQAVLLQSDAAKAIVLKWTPTVFARAYEVQWSLSPNFKDAKSTKAIAPFLSKLVEADGIFYWRVRPVDAAGTPLSEFTPARPLNVAILPRSPTIGNQAVLLYPNDKSTLRVSSDDLPRLGFHWKSPAPVGVFVLEMAKDAAFKEVLFRTTTKAMDVIAECPVNDGKVYWRLSVASQGRTVWTSPIREFTLVEEAALRQPAGN